MDTGEPDTDTTPTETDTDTADSDTDETPTETGDTDTGEELPVVDCEETPWDPSDEEPSGPNSSSDTGYVSVTVGDEHACASRANGEVTCWGGNYNCEATVPDGEWEVVAASGSWTCVQGAAGDPLCWGLPDYTDWTWADPTRVVGSTMRLGWIHGCGIDESGAIACWGHESIGEVTDPEGVEALDVATGANSTCILRSSDGALECWGTITDFEAPTDAFADIEAAMGYPLACGVTTDGALSCWGLEDENQVIPNTPDGEFLEVDPGTEFACGLRADGEVECWGWGNTPILERIPTGPFTTLDVGYHAACAIDTDGRIWCWGEDTAGNTFPP
ncbi:MAG: RCC1 domain-containing protein [Myxococcota bacterium]